MKKYPDISIVILTYNTCELTLQCLSSLKKTVWDTISYEIIVVDNASSDETVGRIQKAHPDIRIIQNVLNMGFAAGNNVGMKRAAGRYILLLNSDTEVALHTIPAMVRFMDTHRQVGASTCAVYLLNETLDPACHRGFPTPWASFSYMAGLEQLFPTSTLFGRYHLGYKNMKIPHAIDCPSGAFFLVRKAVIDEVGFLDEDFFLYGEDIDWAFRIKEKGWEIWFNPIVSILHKKKQSGRANPIRRRRIEADMYFHKNNWLFYTKHYASTYGFLLTCIVNSFYTIRLFMLKTFSL